MPRPLVECVPNFSEGRRPEVVEAIAAAAGAVPGVAVLDREADPSHNRMVLTLAGPPAAVRAAALAACTVAVERIDLTRHTGQHPRMGAVDVVPFVPLRDSDLGACADLARDFGAEFARRFDVPVFLYEAAATRPERRDLAEVRRGQFEGLREAIPTDPARVPDYGPRRVHPTAGATAVGARPVLIAYNVNLRSRDLGAARAIARRVRERDGGLPAVKALGFELGDRGLVQVSMNLTDFRRTGIAAAFAAVSAAAHERGIEVAGSEVVGLVPLAALVPAAEAALRLEGFASDQVIESRLLAADAGPAEPAAPGLLDATLTGFATRLAARDPVPGGGSAAAYAGALGAALVVMVCRLTRGKRGYEAVEERLAAVEAEAAQLQRGLLGLVARDAAAYAGVAAALRQPHAGDAQTADRRAALERALREATEVPAATAEQAHRVLELARDAATHGNRNARSDAETAVLLARAAIGGAWSNVQINLEGLRGDPGFAAQVTLRLAAAVAEVPGVG